MKFKQKIYFILLFINSIYAHGISDSDKTEILHGSLIDFVFLGAKHMITGFDHILFLIGVIFFLTKFSDIVKFVTAFTIGHSVTLIFATLFKITANYYLIDAVIAFSVMYKGFENLGGFNKWFSKKPPNLVLMVFIFGLIHGFGLSTRLQQIHLENNGLIQSIISFNLGVELGQIGALAIVFPILLTIRGSSFDKISKLSNGGLIVAGFCLLIYQLNGFFTDNEHNHAKQPNQHIHLNNDVLKHEHNEPLHLKHSQQSGDEHEHHHGDKKHSHD